MTLLERRRMVLAASGGNPYQRVEWIKSNRCVIRIPLSLSSIKGSQLDLEVMAVSGENPSTAIIAGYGSSGGRWFGVAKAYGTERYAVGSGNTQLFSSVYSGTKKTVSVEWRQNGKVYATIDGTTKGPADILSVTATEFWFFGSSTNESSQYLFPATVTLYSAKLTQNGETLLDLYPCYRKSDNAIGLYDTVTGTFYTCLFGSLTKGSDV